VHDVCNSYIVQEVCFNIEESSTCGLTTNITHSHSDRTQTEDSLKRRVESVRKVSTNVLLTVDQVCDYLQLSRATVYRLLSSGKLFSITIGASRRIPSESLNRFIGQTINEARENLGGF